MVCPECGSELVIAAKDAHVYANDDARGIPVWCPVCGHEEKVKQTTGEDWVVQSIPGTRGTYTIKRKPRSSREMFWWGLFLGFEAGFIIAVVLL